MKINCTRGNISGCDSAFLTEPLNPQQGRTNTAKVAQMRPIELTTELFLYRATQNYLNYLLQLIVFLFDNPAYF